MLQARVRGNYLSHHRTAPARFLAAISNEGAVGTVRILNPETVAEMLSPQFPTVDNGQFVFWYSATAAGRAVIAHNGGDQGVATEMAFSPETGVGVIILMNAPWKNGVGAAAAAIQDLLFERAEAP